jgi:hypothetical protein
MPFGKLTVQVNIGQKVKACEFKYRFKLVNCEEGIVRVIISEVITPVKNPDKTRYL